MTIDKRDKIEVPQWMLSLLVSAIGAVFVFWGLWATVREKVATTERNVEMLRTEKVDRNEFMLFKEQLNKIEHGIESVNTKLDTHIKETN